MVLTATWHRTQGNMSLRKMQWFKGKETVVSGGIEANSDGDGNGMSDDGEI